MGQISKQIVQHAKYNCHFGMLNVYIKYKHYMLRIQNPIRRTYIYISHHTLTHTHTYMWCVLFYYIRNLYIYKMLKNAHSHILREVNEVVKNVNDNRGEPNRCAAACCLSLDCDIANASCKFIVKR